MNSSTEVAETAERAATANGAAGAPQPVTRETMLSRLASDTEFASQIGAFREKFQKSFAQVVLAMVGLPRYRHLSIADLEAFVIEPILRDQMAVVALGRRLVGDATERSDPIPYTGVLISARVSAAVEAKIEDQIRGGVFPIRLQAEDWTSGDIVWLLDVIAPDDDAGRQMAREFAAAAGVTQFRAHPSLGYLQRAVEEATV